MFWYGTWYNADLSSSSPGRNPISLVGIRERTSTTLSYGFFKSNTSFNARYEIILILIFLLYLRLKNEKVNKIKIQIIYNYLFEYLDYSLREIGVGDLSVGKKIKTLARIFSFRMKLYEESVKIDFISIKKLIKKYVYKNKVKKRNLDNFYNYVNSQHKKLKTSNSKNIFSKNFFKEPI